MYVKGEVAKPGRYPLTSNMRVEDLIRVAGGMKSSADTQSAILARQDGKDGAGVASESMSINIAAAMNGEASANPPLNNGDVLTIRKTPGWSDLGATVTIRGEVQHPGTYGIRPGESLSAVLEKAGGFTAQAYPYGTVLTRREVRELEMKTHEELVARLKAEAMQLKTLPENDADQKNAKLTAIAQADTTLTQLETNLPVGRVVIQSSPNLKSFEQAAANTPLRSGDVITIPKKANYVLVNGQVFNATAVGYVSGRSANWYLTQAGGLTQLADKKAVFVIHANGSVLAAKNNSGMWSGDPMNAVLMPGDSISCAGKGREGRQPELDDAISIRADCHVGGDCGGLSAPVRTAAKSHERNRIGALRDDCGHDDSYGEDPGCMPAAGLARRCSRIFQLVFDSNAAAAGKSDAHGSRGESELVAAPRDGRWNRQQEILF